MPSLIVPVVDVRASFVAAMAEDGRAADAAEWADPAAFERYVSTLGEQALDDGPLPPGWVPFTTLWWVDGDEYLGRISIRHRLTPALRELGGHIGYDVRPTARRRGHATAMLRAGLPVAQRLGIDPALITCDVDNVGSRRVIESNRGILDGERAGKLRFWVPTGSR